MISLTTSGLLQIKTVADQLKNVGDLVNIRTCFFIIIIIGKANIQRGGETERKIFCPVTATAGAEPIGSQEPGAWSSSRSPTQVQGP